MNFIERNTKKVALIVCIATAASGVTTVFAAQNSNGWHGNGNDRVYIADGKTKVDSLVFDVDGTYFVNKDGHPITSAWKVVNGQKYYFNKDGKKVSGKQIINGKRYYFKKNGVLPTGWNKSKTSYYNKFGVKLIGIQSIEGVTYNFGTAGSLEQGWTVVNGKNVYFVNGALASGEVEIDGKTYNLTSEGTLLTGWNTIGNEKVYYDDYGFLTTGWAELEGNKYYFDRYGYAVADTTYNGYDFDVNGVATEHKEEEKTPAITSGSSSSSSSSANLPSGIGGIAAAALAQVGVYQDCTALASNALAAVGIYFHGWPADYLSLGTVTTSPQAGDLIYYANGGLGMAHIAVYIGNGQAVHGGWLGNQTVVGSANVGSGPVYIRVTK